MIKFVSLYTHTNTDACLGSLCPLNYILSFRDPTFFNMYASSGHVHMYRRGCIVVLLCFVDPILGIRYGPGVNSLR